ncbi:MAG: glycosyltransferase [Cytophagales bacterium]|nr:glycosyltransferase [Cytophagales bacterium]MCA6369601.1 glycosyltransferase [Cytophagales bacterium]MCA6370685.1 glycosyltransferase [Cytophagales bacterium]MCA6374589.1 glycosyltransferase [Cytophagales bacterium]MCA6383786.1 glycosyltransferase [Cytophagales bacterium]
MKKVSVVIPTYKRDKCLIDLLNCLFIQDYWNLEILVVDQSEFLSNEKQLLIKQYPEKLKYYQIAERGRSLAKNYGITFSSGDIILFCDDDIIVPSNFVSTHVDTYKDKSIGAVSCRLVEDGQPAISVKRPLRTTAFGRLINIPYSTESCYVTSLNGGNMSFRKEVLDQVGFFEEYFSGTSMVEEPDIAYRIIQIGYKIYFNASITVMHYPQHNGNIAEMKNKRADWFYFYFYNLSIFYLKYKRYTNMILVLFYCLLLSIKHSVKYKLSGTDYLKMISGYFKGFKRGVEISKLSFSRKYYTPIRLGKKGYSSLT